jgi:hypothetical protein
VLGTAVLPFFHIIDQIENEQIRRPCASEGSGAPCRIKGIAPNRAQPIEPAVAVNNRLEWTRGPGHFVRKDRGFRF